MHLLIYLREHVSLDMQEDEKISDGFDLKLYVKIIRSLKNQGALTKKEIAMLSKLGLSWTEDEQSWESMYRYAKDYYDLYHKLPERSCVLDNGVFLGAWVDRQKRFYQSCTEEQQRKLRKFRIGIRVRGHSWD